MIVSVRRTRSAVSRSAAIRRAPSCDTGATCSRTRAGRLRSGTPCRRCRRSSAVTGRRHRMQHVMPTSNFLPLECCVRPARSYRVPLCCGRCVGGVVAAMLCLQVRCSLSVFLCRFFVLNLYRQYQLCS